MTRPLPLTSTTVDQPARRTLPGLIALSCLALLLAGLALLAYEDSTQSGTTSPAPQAKPDSTPSITGPVATEERAARASVLTSISDFDPPIPASADTGAMEPPGTGSATLSWMPPNETLDGSAFRGLAAYRIDYGKDPEVLERTIEISNPGVTRYVVEGLTPGTWYFRITAFDVNGDQSLETPVATKVVN